MASKYATYKIVTLHDPALIRPVLPELDVAGLEPDGPDAAEVARRIEAHKLAVDAAYNAWLEQLRIARERQDWDGLLVDRAQPRYLAMRWLPDEVRGWWGDQHRETGGPMGPQEAMRLLVRLAAQSIEGDKPRTFKLTHNTRIDWDVADREALDELHSIFGVGYVAVLLDVGRQVHEMEARGRPL